jgi:hypothetical protein
MDDPTYDKDAIRKNPEWDLAFVLSEITNDRAPIGWGKQIYTAKCLLGTFDVTRRDPHVESVTTEAEKQLAAVVWNQLGIRDASELTKWFATIRTRLAASGHEPSA